MNCRTSNSSTTLPDLTEGVGFSYPDPQRAQSLARMALERMHSADAVGAIDLVEMAIRLDQSGALDGYGDLRALFYASLGRFGPERANKLYNLGYLFNRKDRPDQAEIAYRAAYECDPGFLWPLNNIAWMRATSAIPGARNGTVALQSASQACALSDWNCWAFLETLAASHAANGNFALALKWQKRAQLLAPVAEVVRCKRVLACFEEGLPYIDQGDAVVAGSSITKEALVGIESDSLDMALAELIRPQVSTRRDAGSD